ncbi:MAG TPA: single-stranded DNA-binding protein [Candidatus Limnocylindrales bacterium]
MSLNKAMIIGNLGKDPEMRYTQGGQAVTQFTVAVNRSYRVGEEWKEETEWFRVVAWAALAERTAENLRKGRKVYVEGRLQTRSWEDKDGQKRYTTELIANDVKALDARPREDGGEPGGAPVGRGGAAGPSAPGDDFGSSDLDELPF